MRAASTSPCLTAVPSLRRVGLAVLTLLVAAAAARDAHAEEWAVVLDYGAPAEGTEREAERAVERFASALDVTDALAARGDTVTLLALGARRDGRTRSTDLYKALRAAERAEALTVLRAQADEPGYGFAHPTPPDAALAAALDRHGGGAPLTVLLAGAFGAPPRPRGDDGPAPWDAAPAGSRVLWLGSTPPPVTLTTRAGYQGRGWLVLAAGDVVVRPAPWSPLPADDGAPPPLRAAVRWTARLLPLGGAAGSPPRTLDVVVDGSAAGVRHGPGRTASVARPLAAGREATLALRPRADLDATVVRLAPPPVPVDVRWGTLAADARLRPAEGDGPPVFDAKGVVARQPQRARFRIVRTRSGPAPRWRIAVETEDDRPVPGLTVRVDPEVQTSAHVAEAAVHVELAPPPAQPFTARGTIRFRGGGLESPLALPFEASAPPGRVRLAAAGPPAEQVLPRAARDPGVALRVVPENGNAPVELELVAHAGPAAAGLMGRLGLPDGSRRRVALDAPFRVPVEEEVRFTLVLRAGGSWRTLEPGQVRLVPREVRGVEVEGAVEVPYRGRRPALRIAGPASGDPAYHVEDGRLAAARPLVLEIDPDGGDGDWLLERIAVPPEVTGTGPGWRAVPVAPGRWRVAHEGAFSGPDPDPFRDTALERTLRVTWAEGAAPPAIDVAVVVPARWGARGWWFVALAALALALAGFTVLQLRAPKVTGTLLYTVDGMARTVGRLDLAPVGRRPTVLRVDARGRLTLGPQGDPIGVVRPTRVGGVLEVPGEDGTPERRLLVDGLALRVGPHAMRYVSGTGGADAAAPAPPDVPDLLGPEFDLASGAVEGTREPDRR